MKRTIAACISILLCTALLAAAGCGGQPAPAGSGSGETTQAATTLTATAAGRGTSTAPPAATGTRSRTTARTQRVAETATGSGRLSGLTPVSALPAGFAQGYAQFASELTRRLYTQGENLLYSPASVYLALGMAANGAEGDTAKQMLKTLGAGDLAALNAGCRDLQSLVSGNSEGYFQLANALWLNQSAGLSLKPDFVQANKTYFGARLTVSPFGDTIVRTINDWVAANTGGQIRDLLTPPLDPDVFLIAVNTLLFEGSWAYPFREADTHSGTFHGAGGDSAMPFMFQTLRTSARWYEDDLVEATMLGYADGRTAMLIALPKRDLQTVLQGLQADTIGGWIKGMQPCASLRLTLPRFRLDYRADLRASLSAMGMTAAFDQQRADFRRMTDSREPVWIQTVGHKAALEVTEAGTMAAAATDIQWAAGSALKGDHHTLRVDRPFLCAIVDKPTGAVFFLGAVNQPQALK